MKPARPGPGDRTPIAASGPGSRPLGAREAFSLLEVMVALAITGLIVALVATSFAVVFSAHSRAQEQMDLEQMKNETLERIRTLLKASYLSPYPPNQAFFRFETMDLDNFAHPYDALTFTTLGHTSHKLDAKEADLAEVTLFTVEEPPLESDEGRIELRKLRVRVGGDINDRFEVEGGLVYTLADHVTRLLFEYLGDDGEWRSEWLPADNNFNLPCAVRVTLGLRTESIAEEATTIMVPLELSKLRCRFEDEKVFE